jgi:hypothetical protein
VAVQSRRAPGKTEGFFAWETWAGEREAEEPSVEDEPTVIPLSPGDAPALSADEDGIAIAA